MIIDVHRHEWEYPTDFEDLFRQQAARACGRDQVDLTVRYEDYQATALNDLATIVFGGKASESKNGHIASGHSEVFMTASAEHEPFYAVSH